MAEDISYLERKYVAGTAQTADKGGSYHNST